MELTPAQIAALQHIEDYARSLDTIGQRELANVLAMSNISEESFQKAESQILKYARVGLHFHPDRISQNGKTVAQALLEDGFYKNQFETHVSNGKLDPYESGIRASWEDSIFGGVFQAHKSDLSERPKYGALHLILHPDGPCPRFGSCYFLLKPEASKRCTFTYMDSYRDPIEKGTLKEFDAVFAALMLECFERRFALGKGDISALWLIQHLLTQLKQPFQDPISLSLGRNLNHYIEAQVHGDVSLQSDVDYLVADMSFQGSRIHEQFTALCEQYKIELFWHKGFLLDVNDVPQDFRGPGMPSLAQRVSKDNSISAFLIGEAAADLNKNPAAWSDRGSFEEGLQELKCLWHVLVQFASTHKVLQI